MLGSDPDHSGDGKTALQPSWGNGEIGLTDIFRRKPLSFDEYWLASKAWERKGLTLGTARALVNAGFLTIDDLQTAHDLELSTIPRVGPKSLGILYKLMGREIPEVAVRRRKALPTVTQMTGGKLLAGNRAR